MLRLQEGDRRPPKWRGCPLNGDFWSGENQFFRRLLFAWLIGRPVVGIMLRLSARSADSGVAVAVAVLIVMLSAAGTQALGMEAVLGAFFAGILIGASRWVDRERLAPLRTFVLAVLAPLFFATAGLRMDLTALGEPVVLGAAGLMLLVAIVGKFTGGYIGARLSKFDHWDSLALGAGLNARGVIQMIIAMVGLRLGVLTMEMYTIIVLVAVVTSLMAPPTLRYAVRRGVNVSPEERHARRRWPSAERSFRQRRRAAPAALPIAWRLHFGRPWP